MALISISLLTAAFTSPVRPRGPTARLRLPPSWSDPCVMNVRTAAREFSTMSKSTISAPALNPPPRPPRPTAAGADHSPEGSFATTTPVPARALMRKPIRYTVNLDSERRLEGPCQTYMTNPFARRSTEIGIRWSSPWFGSTNVSKICARSAALATAPAHAPASLGGTRPSSFRPVVASSDSRALWPRGGAQLGMHGPTT